MEHCSVLHPCISHDWPPVGRFSHHLITLRQKGNANIKLWDLCESLIVYILFNLFQWVYMALAINILHKYNHVIETLRWWHEFQVYRHSIKSKTWPIEQALLSDKANHRTTCWVSWNRFICLKTWSRAVCGIVRNDTITFILLPLLIVVLLAS